MSVKEVAVGQIVKYGILVSAVGGGSYFIYRKVSGGIFSLNPLKGISGLGKAGDKALGTVAKKTGIVRATKYVAKGGAVKDFKSARKKTRRTFKKATIKTDNLLTRGPAKYTGAGVGYRATKYVAKGNVQKYVNKGGARKDYRTVRKKTKAASRGTRKKVNAAKRGTKKKIKKLGKRFGL